MSLVIFIDGQFYDEKEAKVSVLDHGYLYGNGCWTTLMTYNHKIFMLNEHIDRLYESAKLIQLNVPWSKEQVIKWTIETYNKNKHNPGRKRIRISFSKGVAQDVLLESGSNSKPSINIIVSKYPEEKELLALEKGLRVIVVHLERVFPESKNCNFLPSYFAIKEARDKGKNDAFFENRSGFITESTTGNIFFFKDNILYTTSSQILKGVTRKIIIDFAKKKGIKTIEKMFKLGELLCADEVFISGTTKLIVPIISINDKKIGNGKPGFQTINLRTSLSDYLFSLDNIENNIYSTNTETMHNVK